MTPKKSRLPNREGGFFIFYVKDTSKKPSVSMIGLLKNSPREGEYTPH